MTYYGEDTLVQETTANYLRDHLDWDIKYAYNEETFGPEGSFDAKMTAILFSHDILVRH